MSTFDASSLGAHHADQGGQTPPADVPPQDVTEHQHLGHRYTDEPVGVSTLDELRSAAAEVDDREPITVVSPRGRIRLTLRTDVTQRDIQKWQVRGLPLKHREQLRRHGGQANLSLLDPLVMFAHAVAETTIQVEVMSQSTGAWTPVTDQRTGELLTFADSALRQVLGGLDTVSAVRRAFNESEPAILEAGQQLIDASGFGVDRGGDEDEGEDPTRAAG